MSNIFSVYRIHFADGAEYFGITSQDLAKRIEQHTAASHNEGVAERMDTGMDFEISLMAQGITKPRALELERGYIRTGKNLLNLIGPNLPRRQQRTATRRTPFSIGLQPDQHEQLKQMAAAEDLSIAHVIRRIIKEALAKDEPKR